MTEAEISIRIPISANQTNNERVFTFKITHLQNKANISIEGLKTSYKIGDVIKLESHNNYFDANNLVYKWEVFNKNNWQVVDDVTTNKFEKQISTDFKPTKIRVSTTYQGI